MNEFGNDFELFNEPKDNFININFNGSNNFLDDIKIRYVEMGNNDDFLDDERYISIKSKELENFIKFSTQNSNQLKFLDLKKFLNQDPVFWTIFISKIKNSSTFENLTLSPISGNVEVIKTNVKVMKSKKQQGMYNNPLFLLKTICDLIVNITPLRLGDAFKYIKRRSSVSLIRQLRKLFNYKKYLPSDFDLKIIKNIKYGKFQHIKDFYRIKRRNTKFPNCKCSGHKECVYRIIFMYGHIIDIDILPAHFPDLLLSLKRYSKI